VAAALDELVDLVIVTLGFGKIMRVLIQRTTARADAARSWSS